MISENLPVPSCLIGIAFSLLCLFTIPSMGTGVKQNTLTSDDSAIAPGNKVPECRLNIDPDCRVVGNSPCLKNGSQFPASGRHSITLYSSRFCPYSARARLLLNAKKLSYNVVNIDPYNKPAWFSQINPSGTVPVLQFENCKNYTRIFDSVPIAVYVDRNFQGKMYQSDDKLLDLTLIQAVGKHIAFPMKKLTDTFSGLPESKLFTRLLQGLDYMENMTVDNEQFLGSSTVLVDFLIWPWFERLPAVFRSMNLPTDAYSQRLPRIYKWMARMSLDPVVRDTMYSTDLYVRYFYRKECDTGLCPPCQ